MSGEPRALEERTNLAREILREAVYQSRAKQAAGTSLALGAAQGASKNCGLGAHAAIETSLSPKGCELAARLWPAPLAPEDAERARSAIEAWIERQDALDRKRNHFLRDFRAAHGFDRARWSPGQLADFDAGLARINEEEDRLRTQAAERLAR